MPDLAILRLLPLATDMGIRKSDALNPATNELRDHKRKKAPSRSEKTPVVGRRRITIAVRKNRSLLNPYLKNSCSANRNSPSLTEQPTGRSYLTTALGVTAVASEPPLDVAGAAGAGSVTAGAGGAGGSGASGAAAGMSTAMA